MELFKGRRFWPALTRDRTFQHLSGEVRTDFAVIGGGMSGMLSAYYLAKAGFSVILLEQDRVAQGSTSLNTGLIQYMSDKTLTELSRDFSEELAVSFYRASREALNRIETAAAALEAEVTFRRNHSLYATDDPGEVAKIRREASAQRSAGFDPEYLTAGEIRDRFGVVAAGAMLTKNDVELNPMAFVLGLAEQASRDYGLKISEGTRVAEGDIDLVCNRITVEDLSVSFDRLILATGYAFYDLARAVMPKARLITTYAAVTSPFASLPAHGNMFWENSRAYVYFRNSPDGRLIIGGGDEEDLELSEKKAEEKADQLRVDVSAYLTDGPIPPAEYSYEAIFGESEDGLPYIGPHPDHAQVYLIHGVGGNGTVYSAIAAGEVLKWAENRSDPLKYLWPGHNRIQS